MMSALGLADYATTALLGLVASALVAGLARGFSGFGAALIFVPLASTVVSPRTAAPLLLIVDMVMAAGLIPNAWRHADRPDVRTMLLGTLIGVPFGTWVLTTGDPIAIRWAIALLIVPLLALLMTGWRYHAKPAAPVTIGVGSVAGFLSGLAQVGGPPIVLYWLGRKDRSETVRANIVLYFAMSTVIALASYVVGGIMTTDVFGLALLIAPIYGVGLLVGSRMFGLASETTFRRICYGLIAMAGLISLPVLDGVIR